MGTVKELVRIANLLVAFPNFSQRLLREQDGLKIYLVDEFAVRNSSLRHQEFTNFATSEDFPDLIPPDEIWVSEEYDPEEIELYIETSIMIKRLLKLGMSLEQANELANHQEKALRERRRNAINGCPWNHNEKPCAKVYKKKLGVADGIEVWEIDGDFVRDCFRTAFVEGGHGYVYSWIPNNEIWIEDSVKPKERKYILCHELTELKLMRDKGMGYEAAHNQAALAEFQQRQANFFDKMILE